MHDMSGSGAAIGIMSTDDELLVAPAEIPGRPDIEAYGIDGPPALAVMAARLGAFGAAPELVVVRHQPRAQHRSGHAALGHRRRRAHRGQLRRVGRSP